MNKVFVYGTLRKGERNAHLLKNAKSMAEQSWTDGKLFDTGYGYPAISPSRTFRTYGELYEVTDKELSQLDQLEGYIPGGSNHLYERVEQIVYTDKGPVTAYVYVVSDESLANNLMANEDWKEYQLLKNPNSTVLYFAYGSCMDDKRFKEDGYDHYFQKMVGVGILVSYSLRFTRKSSIDGMGRADIVEDGGRVEGKVYEIPIEALKKYLYKREGAPNAYRPTFVTIELNGKQTLALTFTVKNKKVETAPPTKYEEEILRGAKGYLSDEYIEQIQNHIHSLKK